MTRNHWLFCVHHLAELRGKPYMNFNLDLKVDKAMNQLSQSKALRMWTYIAMALIIIGIGVWQFAPIILAIVELIKVTK